MGYYEYRFLPDDERERMYQKWCRKNRQDPNADGSGDAFLAWIDTQVTPSESVPDDQPI